MYTTDEPRATPLEKSALSLRPARADDAHACAPLVFASGAQEFRYLLGVSREACIDFLCSAFASEHGRFSWRRHHVAQSADGTVLAVIAAHAGKPLNLDDADAALKLVRHFGLRRAPGILARGLVLESELPAPTRKQILLVHCATRDDARGQGVFTALFSDALRTWLRNGLSQRELVLDVLAANRRAHALYRRLGFVDMAASRKRSRWLPDELKSLRMRFVHDDSTQG